MICTTTSAPITHAFNPDLAQTGTTGPSSKPDTLAELMDGDPICDLQAVIRRAESLRFAIDDASDFCADEEKEEILSRLGRICDFLFLQGQALGEALEIAERFETALRQAGRAL